MAKKTYEPHDRLTHLTVEMTEPLERPENSDVKAIVFLNDEKMGGIQIHGYDADIPAAMTDLLVHMSQIFKANGQRLMLMNEDGMTMLDSAG